MVYSSPKPSWSRFTQQAQFHSHQNYDKSHKEQTFFQRNRSEIKLAMGCSIALLILYSYVKYYELSNNQINSVHERVGESNILKERPKETKIAKSVVNPRDASGLKLTLYQYQTCPFCCKVRAFLDYYGFSYDVVEVNSVTRAQTRWTKYRKVPFLVVEIPGSEYGDSTVLQLKDSSVIMSALASTLRNPSDSFLTILDGYPSFYNEDNKLEFSNRYRIMYGENYREALKHPKDNATELQWRQWVDDKFVHVLSPNVYRTPTEALQAFTWFSEVGNWQELFSAWERLLVVYVGAAAMYFIGKRLKKRHRISDEPRDSLYEEANKWMKFVKSRGGEFAGGKTPNLADLSMYGVLTAIEGCDAFQDLTANTDISSWYEAMKQRVGGREGEQELVRRCRIR
ncbi:hypothetical protein HAZT_HAZT001440 [Hyalella azteca]|nr:hypothetical protein HAZT_HAZT001440 [Hyalella azteca]